MKKIVIVPGAPRGYETNNSRSAMDSWVRRAIVSCAYDPAVAHELDIRNTLMNAALDAVHNNGAFRGDVCDAWERLLGRDLLREVFHPDYLYR